MKKFVKKPVVVEANQFTTNNDLKDIEMDWLVDWIDTESNKKTATWISGYTENWMFSLRE